MKKKLKLCMAFCLVFAMIFNVGGFTRITQVEAATKRATLSAKTLRLSVGEKKKLKVKRKPAGAKLTWKSTNKKIAVVNKKGVVKAKKTGNATIRLKVKPRHGKAYVLKTKVYVGKILVKTIKTNVLSNEMTEGSTFTIRATVSPANAANKSLSYTSSDNTVATVSQNGTVTAKKAGEVNIIVRAKDGSNVQTVVRISVKAASKKDLKGSYGKNAPIRTIVTTDGEGDDQCSMARMMLYANEMDIEGIVYTSSQFHYYGGEVYTNPEQTETKKVDQYRWEGTDWADRIFKDYEEAYPNLKQNAENYPTPEYIRSIFKLGNIKNVGEMYEDTEGSDLIKNIILDDSDPRDVYIQTWGGANTTARALYSIEQQYKGTPQWDKIYKKVCDKVTMYIVMDQDDTFEKYISENWSDITFIKDSDTWWCFAYGWDRESSLTQKLSTEWFTKNIKVGHGSLMADYNGNSYGFMSEGDTPSYFYLLDTGLRSMEDPSYGGWAGRFEKVEGKKWDYDNAKDVNPLKVGQKVEIVNGPTHTGIFEDYTSDNHYTLERWISDFQDDFAARADWCVKPYSKANHRPTVKVKEGLNLTAKAGDTLSLHAVATDPDYDDISFNWWQYFEADSYNGESDGKLQIRNQKTDKPIIKIPEDAKAGDQIHLIVEVQDDASAPMKHYQRVIVTVK